MDRLRQFSILFTAVFFAFAVILGVSITYVHEGSATNPRIWAMPLGGFAALYALLFVIVGGTLPHGGIGGGDVPVAPCFC